jgi:hypothetical protein
LIEYNITDFKFHQGELIFRKVVLFFPGEIEGHVRIKLYWKVENRSVDSLKEIDSHKSGMGS